LLVWINIGSGKGFSSWVRWSPPRHAAMRTHSYIHSDRLVTISAPPYYIAALIINLHWSYQCNQIELCSYIHGLHKKVSQKFSDYNFKSF